MSIRKTLPFLITGALAAVAASPIAQAQPLPIPASPTAFACRDVRQPSGSTRFARVRDLSLGDRLQGANADVVVPRLVCNGADSSGLFEDEHLGGYRISPAKNAPRFRGRFAMTVDNALGRTTLAPTIRDGVLVPAAVNLGGPAVPLAGPNAGFSCYRLSGNGTSGPGDDLQVLLADSFSSATLYDVVRPSRLCYPATVAAQAPPDPQARLVCYTIRRASSEPPAAELTSINIDDRFGARGLETSGRARRIVELCLPSTVPDRDGDGLDDESEGLAGTDPIDVDSDNDGMRDGFEVQYNFDPLNPSDAGIDSDGDLLTNLSEHARGTDPRDRDTDNDGMPDGYEALGSFDPLNPADGSADADSDGLTNVGEYNMRTDPVDADSDNDGLSDGAEVFTYDTQPVDPDTDNDGVGDGQEVHVLASDPNDRDTDDDGLNDIEFLLYGTDPNDADSDNDAIDDSDEIFNGLNPLEPGDAGLDPDSDGLNNLAELAAGSDRNNPDTDADSLSDGAEVNVYGSDPLDTDTDNDGLNDGAEVNVHGTDPTSSDTDGGGRNDFGEINIDGTDPLSPGDDVVAAPPLVSSEPEDGSFSVTRTAWIRLSFSEPVNPALLTLFTLTCNSMPRAATYHIVDATTVVINPTPELPSSSSCTLAWPGFSGPQSVDFSTAGVSSPASILYDRDDPRPVHPFPDDFWTTADPMTATGLRVNVPVPTAPADVQLLFSTLTHEPNKEDGFSPIGHLVVELSRTAAFETLPATAAASLDAMATIGVFDLDPLSSDYAKRIPFLLKQRLDTTPTGHASRTLLIFPSIDLTPGGTYGLVITRRVTAGSNRPFQPSTFFEAALNPPVGGESIKVARVRALASDVIDVVSNDVSPPIPAEDIALAVRFTVRTVDDIPNDLRSVKDQILAAPPAAMTINQVLPPDDPSLQDNLFFPDDIGAVVVGTWQAPDWRAADFFVRTPAGEPVQQTTNTVPFILALPRIAAIKSVPVVMYQHGNPGSAQDEVPFFSSWNSNGSPSLAQAGFAVIGFTDNLNREVSWSETTYDGALEAQLLHIFGRLISIKDVADFWVETNAEQLAFIRALQNLSTLDVLPLGAPDGIPDLDLAAPLGYFGISQGAFHGTALMPYVPEIKAAALTVGGAPYAQTLIHQQADSFVFRFGNFFPSSTPAEIWVGVALFQSVFDPQDGHNHARFVYREPFAVNGSLAKPSILQTEGLNDSLVPNNGTEALGWLFGPLPHVLPVQRPVPFLQALAAPVTANINATTTAAFYQYVPAFVSGIPPTAGCESEFQGHYCPQTSPPALSQRAVFLKSAVTNPVPTVISPLAP